VFVCFLGLFWTREGVGENLAPEGLYLFLCALILLLLARNAFICVHYFSMDQTWLLAVQLSKSRSGRPVGTIWLILKLDG
jgi:hypothetical protein